MMVAARNPDKVRKMVVWGANAYVTEADMNIYNGKYIIFLPPLKWH